MDLSQATRLLTWLDEEHRKDKALLLALQGQIEAQKVQATEQTRQLQDIQAAVARMEGRLSKLAQFEDSVQSARSEFATLLSKHTAEQEQRLDQRARADKNESEAMARLIRQLQERVESLGSFDASVALLRDDDSRLQGELTKTLAQIAEINKHLAAQDQRLELLAQEGRGARDGLASAKESNDELRNQIISARAALDALSARMDTRSMQLEESIQTMGQTQGNLEPLQVRLQEQGRAVEDLGKEFRAIQVPINRWSKQIEEMTSQFERNRKVLHDLQEMERQVRMQGSDLLELQRVATERQRAEMHEWQDNQGRVDEEMAARLGQLEAFQRKATTTLGKLDERLKQAQQAVMAHTNELWEAWADYARQQADLFGKLKQRGSG